MKKHKVLVLLASLGMLFVVQAVRAQIGYGWTNIPWTNPGVSPPQGNRATHFQKQSDVDADDNNDWYNQDGIVYAFNETNPPIGTYELRTNTGEFVETFRQYGPTALSIDRTEIRIEDNYNSGEIRQFESYVTLNDKISAGQAFFQIWGWSPNATMIQLRITSTGRIHGVGGASPAELFSDTDYRNREFKLNVIHRQETRNGSTVTSAGHCSVYIDGRLLLDFDESHITNHDNLDYGADYFKYGVYGDIDSAYNNTAPGVVNAQAIFKDARYWRSGNFPGGTTQTITFNSPGTIYLGGSDVAPGATSDSGLTVSYRSDNPQVATIVAGKIHPVSAGTAKIWAYQDGNSTYRPARVVVQTVTVSAPLPTSAPTFSPSGGVYTSPITMLSATNGASIRYTTDGITAPSDTVGTLYTGPVTLTATTTLRAIAYKAGHTNSTETSDTYTVSSLVVTRVNDRTLGTGQNQFAYSANWTPITAQAGNHNSDFTQSNVAGSTVTVRFIGTQISLFGKKKPDSGIASFSIDGGPAVNADFYATAETFMSNVWTSPVLVNGPHTLTVTITGTKRTASTGTLCRVDFVDVTSDASLPLVYEVENLARTSTSGITTQVDTNASYSAGYQIKLNSTAATQFVSFTLPSVAAGTYNVTVYYTTLTTRGIFQASIDGVNQGTVGDQYSASTAYQVAKSLGNKAFTGTADRNIRFTVTGKNAASTGYSLSVDKIVLTPQ
jgi:hypothetical protein